MLLHFVHESCKKIKSSAFSGINLVRPFAILPAVENNRSTGADVVGIHKIFFAI